MKRLFIIRHAKSSWKDASLSDYERPLNKRGKHDAPLMSKLLNQANFCPEFIVSSPANRAKSTAEYFIKEFNLNEDQIKYESSIYEAGVSNLLRLVNQLPNQTKNVFLFGHNPGMTFLAEYLTGDYFGNIPTCGIAGIEFQIEDWLHVSKNSGTCFYYDYPKKHY